MADETKQGTAPELTIRELCAALKIAQSTYFEWRALGIIPPPYAYSRRCKRHPQSHLDELRAKAAAGQVPTVDREAIRRQRREARAAQTATATTT